MNSNVFVERDTKQSISRKFQNNAINYVKQISSNGDISTSNHMFKREIWDKFTEFTFLKF